ncbi:WbuC family cupin fold metalloprotein [Chitinibacter bivalviorum]|uniref:WbuC family cupin fold metalloprotein n=1 Tax=Chitinibacter bivalviorum TaxID=2739434 RepID=A0A7H9BGH2_9NEIS|nr:WbuC family cupin fold metalloprotein [Chitinibacter bivalviorum]QLG87823.1 WbuC family cupin fold metalloprotein [Chitinibacter bivalviorum]
MTTYSVINQDLLSGLLAEAADNPRLRKNRNFHPSDDAACHRLANALQPGTYVHPHRHMDPNKAETMIILQGELGVLIFAEDGQVIARHHLVAGGENVGINIEAGAYHSVLALTPCVFFEAKAGPYVPVAANELAPWAPAANDDNVAAYLDWMVSQF